MTLTTEGDQTKSVDIGVEETPDTPPAPAAEDQKAETAESTDKPEGTEDKAQESEKSDETEQQEQKKSRFQRRLERQKEARIRAETEARMLRERLTELEGRKQQPQEAGEPKRDQFENYEDYVEARATYRAEMKAKELLEQAQRQAQQQGERSRAAVEHERIAATWNKAEQAFSKTHKDYEQVVTPFVEDELGSLSEPARRAIVESDLGPNVLYHLATNPEDADRIANLSPTQQVKELGKLELKLSIPARDKTSAPPPPSHERGSKSKTTDIERMTDDEYYAYRKAQGARWAR